MPDCRWRVAGNGLGTRSVIVSNSLAETMEFPWEFTRRAVSSDGSTSCTSHKLFGEEEEPNVCWEIVNSGSGDLSDGLNSYPWSQILGLTYNFLSILSLFIQTTINLGDTSGDSLSWSNLGEKSLTGRSSRAQGSSLETLVVSQRASFGMIRKIPSRRKFLFALFSFKLSGSLEDASSTADPKVAICEEKLNISLLGDVWSSSVGPVLGPPPSGTLPRTDPAISTNKPFRAGP